MSSVRPISRLILVVGALSGGCARVASEGDYANAGRVVTDRTGADEFYDPAVDDVRFSGDQLATAQT